MDSQLEQDNIRLKESLEFYKQTVKDYAENTGNLLNQIKERDILIKDLAQSRNEWAERANKSADELIRALKELNCYKVPMMN
jgi:DNA anti-recombination protein RmuC